MITSDRRFGVEIEFCAPNARAYSKIQNALGANLVDDGSIRHISYSSEYVSPILQGASGVSRLFHDCEILKMHNASADNVAMSTHIHLDGNRNRTGLLRSGTKTFPNSSLTPTLAMSSRLFREIPESIIKMSLSEMDFFRLVHLKSPELFLTHFNGIAYLSLGCLKKEPTKNFIYLALDEGAQFRWLQKVLYFYTLYSRVLENMVSNSRRMGNMYCIPLDKSYDAPDIAKLQNIEELKRYWYKGLPSSGKWDNSRYHSVNLHSYFHNPGTVEIRCHGGTIDPKKILLWVRLHQKILDKLETVELNKIQTNDNLYVSFHDFIEEPVLQEYFKRLIGYYSNIKIN